MHISRPTMLMDLLVAVMVSALGKTNATRTKFSVRMTTSCSHTLYKLNEYQSYNVSWDGMDPGMFGCEFSFLGKSELHTRKKYKVCVTMQTFHFQSVGISLIYTTGGRSSQNTVNSRLPENYCSKENELIGIKIEADMNMTTFLRIDTSQSYFSLLIVAVVTDEGTTNNELWLILGSILGALTVIFLVAVFACHQISRASRARSRCYGPGIPLASQDRDTEDTRLPLQCGQTSSADLSSMPYISKANDSQPSLGSSTELFDRSPGQGHTTISDEEEDFEEEGQGHKTTRYHTSETSLLQNMEHNTSMDKSSKPTWYDAMNT